MNGKNNIRFSELFADTVATHGVFWAMSHYIRKGMSLNEFQFWCKSVGI